MCGIFGAFSFTRAPVEPAIINRMSQSIHHRGPDADGQFVDDLVLVGNRRLSILDMTSASNQPLYSSDKQIVLVQNGEIYNYIELRDELRKLGAKFESAGDTEVLLRAYEFWGADFVNHLNGMFAIAVYDRKLNKLLLYRDRLGVKPLYIAGSPNEGRIWFGSEIKTILANGQKYVPNMDALGQYFALNYIPQPHTAFSGICHLPPGHMASVSIERGVEITRYWDLASISPDTQMSEADAKAGLLKYLDDGTRVRMRSDAPFGAFLSGGLIVVRS